MDILDHPQDTTLIIRKSKSIKKELLGNGVAKQKIKIAVLGGSTTSDVIKNLEIFLLNYNIEPQFYESEYGLYFEDSVVDNTNLKKFKPDVVIIHTTNVNIHNYPQLNFSEVDVLKNTEELVNKFVLIWDSLEILGCNIIQNNFDYPSVRPLGLSDSLISSGKTAFINKINMKFHELSQSRENLVINDICYLSAQIGISKWFDESNWYGYKMAVSFDASVSLGHVFAKITKLLYQQSYKCLVLDLDNTLWGGVIGDDGLGGIKIGQGSAIGEAYSDFQKYCKSLKEKGILLAVCSKNDLVNAVEGFDHPDSILKYDDFSCFKAN